MRQRPRPDSASHRRSVTAVSTRGHHRVTVIGAGPAGSPETKGLKNRRHVGASLAARVDWNRWP
jgi:NADPH-dependent glutamate synthase beta subunit-like oxidoreductase